MVKMISLAMLFDLLLVSPLAKNSFAHVCVGGGGAWELDFRKCEGSLEMRLPMSHSN